MRLIKLKIRRMIKTQIISQSFLKQHKRETERKKKKESKMTQCCTLNSSDWKIAQLIELQLFPQDLSGDIFNYTIFIGFFFFFFKHSLHCKLFPAPEFKNRIASFFLMKYGRKNFFPLLLYCNFLIYF